MATAGEYLQTWKLKAQHYKNGVGWGQPSILTTRKLNVESQLQQRNPALLLRAQVPRSMGVERIFPGGPLEDFSKIFSGWGQKWWNSVFPLEIEKQTFFAKIFKTRGDKTPPAPLWRTCLGVKLARSLTYRRHLESLRKKLTSRVALMRRLAGSGWGAGATTLWTATLALVHSTAECCAPVWCRSAHTRLIASAVNDALRIVTGCQGPTPADNLPILAGIQPAELRRKEPHCL